MDLISRRSALIGAAGLAAAVGLPGAALAAPRSGYDTPPAFRRAQQAYLALGFEHNEAGGYAWGESYFLLGLLRMYQAHGDREFLKTFVDRLDHVTGTTDEARGVTDYQGRSGPVWRTAGNYTAGHGVINDGTGAPAVQVRWAGIRSAESTAEISAVSGDTFTLTLRNPATSTVITRTGLSLDPTSANYAVKVINAAYATGARWTAVDLRDQPAAAPAPSAGTVAFESQYYVFAVHTGMVAYPLALFARMVAESRVLRRSGFGPAGERAGAAAAAAIAFHDDEFVINGDGLGDYVWPKGAPIPFDGLIQPYNQSHGPGQAMAELYRVTGDNTYRDKVSAMLASLAGGITSDGAAYVWPYWPVHSELYTGYAAADERSTYTPFYPPVRSIEDISHAAISLEFAAAARLAGITRDDLDPVGFARTFTDNVIRSATEVWRRVDGTAEATLGYSAQAPRWMPYAQYDNEIYAQCLRVYDAVELEPTQGSHALGIAYLNWARMRGWERA